MDWQSSISSSESSDETSSLDSNFDTDKEQNDKEQNDKEQNDKELNDKCFEYKKNDIIQCNNDIKVKCLHYLGYSIKGCSRYMGMNIETKELLYITEWNISYSQIRKKCPDSCFWLKKDKCIGHTVDDFIVGISSIVKNLSDIRQQNLVAYECVSFIKYDKKKELILYLVQEFVHGCDISCITKSIGWHTESIKILVKGILEALAYLQNPKYNINHNFLYDTTVILDNSGNIRCTDFYLVPKLSQMIGSERKKSKDLQALVKLIEKSVPVLANDIKDFIDRCKLGSSPLVLIRDEFLKRSNSIQCRIKNEFDELERLGNGAFGEVMKVRNKLDCNLYAIKKITLPSKNTKKYKKIDREVKLLSKLQHKNVVRYFNSWIQMTPVEDDEMDEMDQIMNENYSDEMSYFQSSFFKTDTENTTSRSGKSTISKPSRELMYIQMEFCENSTLRRLIDSGDLKKTFLDEKKKFWRFFKQILDGLSYIHFKKMIHRDLKPDNILLDSKDRIKIGDFGLATTRSPELDPSINAINSGTGVVGTKLYIAPEIISGNHYTNKVDMYSLGIIFFEMSNPRFTTVTERSEVIMSLREQNREIHESMFKIFKDFPSYGKNIAIAVGRLLNHNPKERQTAPSLLNWLRSNIFSLDNKPNKDKPDLSTRKDSEMTFYTQLCAIL